MGLPVLAVAVRRFLHLREAEKAAKDQKKTAGRQARTKKQSRRR
jgi:hypothetical protein